MDNLKFDRRDFLRFAALSAAGVASGALGGLARAQSGFPNKPINVIVPFGVGGGTDIWVRALGAGVSDKASLGVPVTTQNIPGAASLRGTGAAFQAKPDGYSMVAFNPPSTPWAWYIHQPPFDITQFRGVSVYVREPGLLIANPGIGLASFDAVMKAYSTAKIKVIASEQTGTVWSIAAILLQRRVHMGWSQYVSYDGTADIIAAVMKGEVPVGIVTTTSAMDVVRDKRVVPIAVIGSDERVGAYPDVPTLKELGQDPLSACVLRRSFYAPPGTPDDILGVLEKAWTNAQDAPAAKKQYEASGLTPAHGTGAEADKAIQDAIATAKEVDLRNLVKSKKK